MEDLNKEQMVTITLREYDNLREKANINILAIDKITNIDFRLRELENRLYSMSGDSKNEFVSFR